jgi:predicted nuclease of predicted toxin-antitoxin system
MKLLLDQGLPRSAVSYLAQKGTDSQHTGDCGLATANDSTILDRAREQGWIIVTLDSDFHTQLAISRADRPSVIRIRIEGLRGQEIADLVAEVVRVCESDLQDGAMVSVTSTGIRVRRIPLLRRQ